MKKGLSLEQKIHEYCYHNFSHNYLILFVISGATMKPISHQVKVQNRSYLMKKYIMCMHMCFQVILIHHIYLKNTQ